MIETIFVMIFLIIAFFMIAQFADNFRARLVLDYAAGRCARSRTVGMNDFMILKTARLATMSVAGENLTPEDSHGKLSAYELVGRMGTYLSSRHEGEVNGILDFELWRNGKTQVDCTEGGQMLSTTVTQYRPQFFDLKRYLSNGESSNDKEKIDEVNATIRGHHTIEAHYPDYLN